MTMRKHLRLFGALLLAVPTTVWAQRTGTFLEPTPDQGTSRVAQRGANFLEIGVGARARGMGDAFSGLASGAIATYWNPAGLSTSEKFGAAFSYLRLYDDLDIDHAFAAVSVPMFGGAAAISFIRLNSGDMLRTTENDPGGNNQFTGQTFSWSSQALGIHYGRRLTDRLQVGVSGRFISEGISQASIAWWGVDVGTVFNSGLYGITLGAVLANVGPRARFEGGQIARRINTDQAFPFTVPVRLTTTEYTLPTAFRFSVVSNLVGGADALLSPSGRHDLKVAWDLNDATDTDIQLSVGAEYSFNRFIFLRAGKKFVNEGQAAEFRSFSHALAFGGGFRLPVLGQWVGMDYAYTNMGELQNVHAFSFELGGGQ
jgi:hypothetical protein